MRSTLQNSWHFSNISLLHVTIQIDTSICIANSCWQVLIIKEEFLCRELLLESAESMPLAWWRISLPNKFSGRIKILALWALIEHLWCLATHLVLLLWWRNLLLVSTCSGVSQCQRLCQGAWKKCVYFYECCQPLESQGWHTISRGFVKKWKSESKFVAAIQTLTSFPEDLSRNMWLTFKYKFCFSEAKEIQWLEKSNRKESVHSLLYLMAILVKWSN